MEHLVDEVEAVRLGDQLPRFGVVGATERAGDVDEVGGERARLDRTLGLLFGTRAALVHEHRARDPPAVVDVADAIGVGDDDVVEELLAEVGAAVDQADHPQGDARRVDRHAEPGDAAGAWARSSSYG